MSTDFINEDNDEASNSQFSLSNESIHPQDECEDETISQMINPTLNASIPVGVQLGGVNCMASSVDVAQEIVVISPEGNMIKLPRVQDRQPSEIVDTGTKRICLEQDGQTFILTVPSSSNLGSALDINQIVPTVTDIDTQSLVDRSKEPINGESDVNQAWFTSREDKSNLQNKGHLWKQGMWSKEENELLEENIQNYCQERDLSDPSTIIFEMSKDKRKDFYRTIAKGLNRPLFSVYRRVIRMYDNKNHVGKYTTDEIDKLRKLRSSYGNDWQAIGAAMGRSASSIKDRCRLLKENCNQGKWLPSEERHLAEAVYELANVVPGEMISSGLSWAAVAERVGTRSEKQCRTKWLNYLNWKEAGGAEWTREDDVTLIYRICSLNKSDENNIDWSEIAKNWPSVRSPQWLRGKWWALKRHVPNASVISFPEICDYLYQNFAQKVRIKDSSSSSTISAAEAALRMTPSMTITRTTDPSLVLQEEISNTSITTQTGFLQSFPSTVTSNVSSTTIASVLSEMNLIPPSLSVTPMIPTLGVIPQGLSLPSALGQQAFLLTQQSPMTLGGAVPPGQIIIRTIGDNLQLSDGTLISINNQPQIIINSSGGPVLLQNQDLSLVDGFGSPVMSDGELSNEYAEHYEDDDDDSSHNIVMSHNISDIVMSHSISEDDGDGKSDHLIMSDVMLAAGRSPETLESPADMSHDKDSLS